VTTRQKSRALPRTTSAAPAGPWDQAAPDGSTSSTRTSPGGGSSPRTRVDLGQGVDTGVGEAVDHVLAVGPGLHQPGRGEGPDRHRGPVPGHPGVVGHCCERLEHGRSPGPPGGQQLGAGRRAAELLGPRREGRQVTERDLEVGGEAGGVRRRAAGLLVVVGKVPDLVTDPPARRRRGHVPGGVVEADDHGVEGGVLVGEIGQEGRSVVLGHRTILGPPGRTGNTGCVPLTDRDRAILDFERSWWTQPGPKETAIRDRFELSPTRYYEILNELLEDPDAMDHDPLLIRRLRRLRDRRRRQRFEGRPAKGHQGR
jgi:hypothetical protein